MFPFKPESLCKYSSLAIQSLATSGFTKNDLCQYSGFRSCCFVTASLARELNFWRLTLQRLFFSYRTSKSVLSSGVQLSKVDLPLLLLKAGAQFCFLSVRGLSRPGNAVVWSISMNSAKLPIIFILLIGPPQISVRLFEKASELFLRIFNNLGSYPMENLLNQISNLLHLNTLDDNDQLAFVEEKTGIKPSAFVIALAVFLLIVSFISNATSLVVGIGCCAAPAYFTFLILESGNRKALKKYLIYWIIYATFELIGPAVALLLPSFLYIVLRIGTAVALLHPDSTLAERVYSDLINPFLQKYQKDIDKRIENAVEKGRQGIKKGKNYVEELVGK